MRGLRDTARPGNRPRLEDGILCATLRAPHALLDIFQFRIPTQELCEHVRVRASAMSASRLRERGVLIVGSGNIVHNLRAVQWDAPDFGFDWAHRFDDAARAVLLDRSADIESLREHPDFDRAVPTPDHFIPLLYFAGLASVADRPVQELITGCALGSISMTSYTLGMAPVIAQQELDAPAANIPDPSEIPAEQTNL